MRKSWPGLALVLGAVLLAVAGALYVLPSNEYIFLPDPPKNVAPLVDVPGEQAADEQGGIYMVDIIVRKGETVYMLPRK